MTGSTTNPAVMITPQQFLVHWQAHRRLSRRAIVAFPDDKLFSFSVGGMRPFGELANEMLGMAVPTVHGILTEEWKQYAAAAATTKVDVLQQWDDTTTALDQQFGKIPIGRFQEVTTAFGQWKMPVYDLLLYLVDNEIHHRGQGYVYLRALGVEPPPFYDRS